MVYAGQIAYLSCALPASSSLLKIQWLKDEHPLALDKRRMTILPSGTEAFTAFDFSRRYIYIYTYQNLIKHNLFERRAFSFNIFNKRWKLNETGFASVYFEVFISSKYLNGIICVYFT